MRHPSSPQLSAIAGSLLLALFCQQGGLYASDKAAGSPLRVILCIDASGSMCEHLVPDRCCTAGDSSGFCAKNDPTNMRIEASRRLVDTLRAHLPASEVGVIKYSTSVRSVTNPIPLTSDENYSILGTAIIAAGCQERGGLDKIEKTMITNIGIALQRAFVLADTNYEQSRFQRHIILMTDGVWDDNVLRPPEGLLNAYQTSFPGREVPVVHVIFISDSATHVAHGYPPEGCGDSVAVDRTPLHTIATLTNGTFNGSTTPQTITATMFSVLFQITATEWNHGDGRGTVPIGYSAAQWSSGTCFDLCGRKVLIGGRGGNGAGIGTRPGIYLGSSAGTGRTLKPFLLLRP